MSPIALGIGALGAGSLMALAWVLRLRRTRSVVDLPETFGRNPGLLTFDGEGDPVPPVHPAFAAHFTASLYTDPADGWALFSTDEGFDLLYAAADLGSAVSGSTTVAELLESTGLDSGTGRADVSLSAAAFVLIRLTGQVDEAGKHDALQAVDRLLAAHEDPTLRRQRTDLAGWRNPAVV